MDSKEMNCLWLKRSLWLCPGLPSIGLSDIKNLETEDYSQRHSDDFISNYVVGPVFHKSRHYSSRSLDPEGNAVISTSIFLGLLSFTDATQDEISIGNLIKLNEAMIAFGAYPLCRHKCLGQLRMPGPLEDTCPFERINMTSKRQSHNWFLGGYDLLDACPCHLNESKGKVYQPLICDSPECNTKITFSLYQDCEKDPRRGLGRVAIHIKRNFGPPSLLTHESTVWINQVDEWADSKCRQLFSKACDWNKNLEKAERRAASKYQDLLLRHWERGMQYVEVKSAIDERTIRFTHPPYPRTRYRQVEVDWPFEFLAKSSAGIGELEITLRHVVWQIMAQGDPPNKMHQHTGVCDNPEEMAHTSYYPGLMLQDQRESSRLSKSSSRSDSPFKHVSSVESHASSFEEEVQTCRFLGIKEKFQQITDLFKKRYAPPSQPEMLQQGTIPLLKRVLTLDSMDPKDDPTFPGSRRHPQLTLGGFDWPGR